MNPEDFKGKKIGEFTLIREIGEGAFSSVYLAEQTISRKDDSKDRDDKINDKKEKKATLTKSKKTKGLNEGKDRKRGRCVACKIIPRTKIEAKKMTTRLDQEIKVHQLMHHPNVVQLIDVQKDQSFYYVFLEFCPCGELFDYVIDKKRLTEHEAAVFFKQILIGLKYIHSLNVAHRDLKPENILIDQYGRIKISDFGLSKLIENKMNGLTKTPCGSPCYASPECISGHPYDGKKSDIWSCGVILYAITTGLLPWTKRNQAKMFQQIRHGEYAIPSFVSNTCANLINRLMTVDNKQRITIEEALEHPFLKNIAVPNATLDPKFVSLRKVDLFLGFDKNFHLDKMIENMSEGRFPTYSKFNPKVLKDQFLSMKEKINELSSIVKPRGDKTRHQQKGDRNARQLLIRINSKMNLNKGMMEEKGSNSDKDNNYKKIKGEKKRSKNNIKKNKDDKIESKARQVKEPKLPPFPTNITVAPRKVKNTNTNVNEFGYSTPIRRSEQSPVRIIY
ncbi:hypothetical protein M9Y10_020034 [Tritrichomonas musculus]|uniref:Protein kinase domain-containing protein n=1 Tax=Tritrichomonas musculus TaxID=1915356 RepID=A0ABR2HG07_9EUKA